MVFRDLTPDEIGNRLREAGTDAKAWLQFAATSDYELRSRHHGQYYGLLNLALETEPFVSNIAMWYHLCSWTLIAPSDPARHLSARRRILELAPDSLSSYLGLAGLLSTLGTPEAIEARALYETVVGKWSSTPVGWQRLIALEWDRFGDVPAALQTLERGIGQVSDYRSLWAGVANQLVQGRAGPSVVEPVYESFLKQPIRPARALRSFGAALLAHNPQLGLAALRSAVETEPWNHRCWIELAEALKRQGRRGEGIETLDDALSHTLSKVPVWCALLEHHGSAGSSARAFSELAQRLRSTPFGDDRDYLRAGTWERFARQFILLGEYHQAEMACRRSLGERPSYSEATTLLIWLLTYRLGRHKEAIETADARFDADWYDRKPARYKAHAYGEGLQRWDEAIEVLRSIVSKHRYEPETWAMLAVYLSWQTADLPDRQSMIDEEAALAFKCMRDSKSAWARRHYGNFLRDKRYDVAAANKAFQRADDLERT